MTTKATDVAQVAPVAQVAQEASVTITLTMTEAQLINTALTQQVAYNARQAERFGAGVAPYFKAQGDMSIAIIGKLGQTYKPRAERARK